MPSRVSPRTEEDVSGLLDQVDCLTEQVFGLGVGTGLGEAGQRLLVPLLQLVGEALDDENVWVVLRPNPRSHPPFVVLTSMPTDKTQHP